MNGVVANNLTAKAWAAAVVVSWWGTIASEAYHVAVLISKCAQAIFSAVHAWLALTRGFDPLVFTIGFPTAFGLGSAVVIPYYLYDSTRSLLSKECWQTKTFTVLSNIGSLGVALGAVLRSVDYIWHLSISMQWLPPFQILSATVSALQVGISGVELHRLKEIRQALDAEKGKVTISKESAARFLDIPSHKYEEFKEIVKKEPDGGVGYVKRRLDAKIKEQSFKVTAGLISVIALAILTAVTFASPIAPIALVLVTIGVYVLLGASAGFSGYAAYHKFRASDPKLYATPREAI